jgi:flagellar motor switch protein FliN/FliY
VAESNESQPHAWLAEEWARQLTHVLESMTGEVPDISFEPYQIPDKPETEGWQWWEQPFSLGPEARIWAGANEKSWKEIGGRVLRSAGIEDGDAASIRSTYLEIVRQALAAFAGTLGARARKEVSCTAGLEVPPQVAASKIGYSFEITMGEAVCTLIVAFSTTLLKAPDLPEPSAQKAATDADKLALERAGSPEAQRRYPADLLLDVELPVRVSFGRAQLALKDVIKLTTGSIIELNRAVTEPVEVIVNNCVIARGEVVVVEGNFGVRIKQVISRQERLRTLY